MHAPEIDPAGTPPPTEAAAAPEQTPPPPGASGALGLGKQVAPWWHTALVIVILIGISTLGGVGTKKQNLAGHQIPTYVFTIILEWVLLGIVWWGLRLRRVPLKTLLGERHGGWKGFGRDVAYAAVFWIMAILVLDLVALLVHFLHIGKVGPSAKVLALAPRTPLEFLLWFLVCVTAGICEEMIFRGYLLRQFSSIGGRVWLGVVASSVIFGSSHGYEGIAVMIVITVYGILFCLLLLKTRSLRPGMIAHGWHDFITGIAFAALHHLH